jgi:epoxyqueuosine reductase
MNDLKETLRKEASSLGGTAFGVADLSELTKDYPTLFDNIQGEYPVAVVLGVRLQAATIDEIKDQPTHLYFHHYKQANLQLDRLALRVADLLQNEGARALPMPASQIIKRDPMRGHISHRALAVQAGIGFRGRSNLLVHPEHGARLRYVSVLTNAALPTDAPYTGDGCGECRACITACPAKAIRDDRADYDLNACYEKLSEFAGIPRIGQHICGVCIRACTAEARKSC